jgi:RNA ligase (TIGR02306 family)
MEDIRRLVTRETIADIRAIVDADAIEAVVVRGWTVVAKKGEFAVGDACVYIEIDAALPLADERFTFLEPRGAKTLGDGTKVHVLKTARMRGVYSQGLALPIASFPEVGTANPDDDLASLLGIEKYEPPVPASMEAEVVGAFPTSLARKTDAERAQNLGDVWPVLVAAGPWIATEKLDGTSVTVINDSGVVRVCGRNWELVDGPNLYWRIVRAAGVLEHLAPGEVLQAEIYGEGVQANPLKVRGTHLGVFGFFLGRESVPHAQWPDWVAALAVPRYDELTLAATIENAVAEIDGIASKVNPTRGAEGVVWARESGEPMNELDGRSSFKVISNKYLLKHG